MGALSLAFGQQTAGPGPVAAPGMTLGQTTVSTTPTGAVSMAVPAVKGPAPLPSEQQSAADD
jgi:hypothetical protein